jgi:divalent metal cation (Fe/Co/Zn/Cd) transporter
MPGDDPVRAGLRVSWTAALWTAVTSTLAVIVGLAANTLVLVAFGLVGYLDAAGSFTLVVHFRHTLHHEAFSERHERLALRVVTIGLVVVGAATTLESLRRLAFDVHGSTAIAGLVLAALSLVILSGLSVLKQRIGREIPSRALVADGWLSAVGALLAAVTLAGTALAEHGWWWIDPLAAAIVGATAITAGIVFASG